MSKFKRAWASLCDANDPYHCSLTYGGGLVDGVHLRDGAIDMVRQLNFACDAEGLIRAMAQVPRCMESWDGERDKARALCEQYEIAYTPAIKEDSL